MKLETIEYYLGKIQEYALDYVLQLFWALLTLVIGLWIISKVIKGIKKVFAIRHVDETLQPFLINLISWLLKIVLFVSVVSMLGVKMTSVIAILGAAGLAVGMALSGTLQNFAGGVMLLIFKPFKVGDFIDAQGYQGVVSEIQIFNTMVKTVDNKVVILPNGGLATGAVVNFSKESTRRVDFVFGIGYGDDIDKAKGILFEVINSNSLVLKDPAPFVAVSELGDSSVNFATRVWVETANYWSVYFDIQEAVKKAFDQNGISIPFPQRDVHLYNSVKE